MKQIVALTTFSLTLVLACLSVAAQTQTQTQSRDDVIKEIETKRAELAVLEKKVLELPTQTERSLPLFSRSLRQE